MNTGMLCLAILLAGNDADSMPLVTFGEPSGPEQVTREMQEALRRIRTVHGGMDEDVVRAAVDGLFADFAHHDPRIFVRMILNDMMRLAPRDRRTLFVLRRSLENGWMEPALARGFLVQAGAPPEEHVKYLASELENPDVNRRIAAIRGLEACGAEAKDALPRLEEIVRKSKGQPEDYKSAYNWNLPMPEHVHAYHAIRSIKKRVDAKKGEEVPSRKAQAAGKARFIAESPRHLNTEEEMQSLASGGAGFPTNAAVTDEPLPNVELDFTVMSAQNWKGKRFHEIVPADAIKRIIRAKERGFSSGTTAAAAQIRYDAVVRHLLRSSEIAKEYGVLAQERCLAELIVLTSDGDIFLLELLASLFHDPASPTAVLIHGKGRAARMEIKGVKFPGMREPAHRRVGEVSDRQGDFGASGDTNQ